MTPEPLLHWPTMSSLASCAVVAALSLIPAAVLACIYGIKLGVPPKLVLRIMPRLIMLSAPRPLLKFTLYLVAIDVTRRDIHPLVFAAYFAWIFFGKNIPWDKMKKKLGSTISSLTEVARATLQRQQSEAFS